MKRDHYKKDAVVACIMIGAIIVLASTIAPFFHPPKEVEALNNLNIQKNNAQSDELSILPERLLIPFLNINAPVEQLGVSTENSIMAPSKPGDVAWFKYGAKPGEKGTAIISGHVDWIGGLPAIFKDLNTIETGTDIFIEGSFTNASSSIQEGTTTSYIKLHYKVKEVKTVDYSDNHILQDVLQQKDTSEIMLITCFGEWLSENKTFDKRLIVIADLISKDLK